MLTVERKEKLCVVETAPSGPMSTGGLAQSVERQVKSDGRHHPRSSTREGRSVRDGVHAKKPCRSLVRVQRLPPSPFSSNVGCSGASGLALYGERRAGSFSLFWIGIFVRRCDGYLQASHCVGRGLGQPTRARLPYALLPDPRGEGFAE